MSHCPAQASAEVGLPRPTDVEAPGQAHQLPKRGQRLLGTCRIPSPATSSARSSAGSSPDSGAASPSAIVLVARHSPRP